MNEMTTVTTAKDWASDQEVRWCPGCGDYAVLKAVQRTMPDLGVAREKTVFVSGIKKRKPPRNGRLCPFARVIARIAECRCTQRQ